MSLVLNMCVGGGGSISTTDAILRVSAPIGSTVTITKGALTKTADGHTQNEDNTLATWLFIIHQSEFNSTAWTVTASKSGSTTTASVVVNEAKEYTVYLSFTLYLVQNGVPNAMYTATKNGYSAATITQESGYLSLEIPVASSSYTTCYFDPAVTIQQFAYLVCDASVRGYFLQDVCPTYGVLNTIDGSASHSDFVVSRTLLSANSGTLTTRATTYISLAGLTGLRYIGFQAAGSGYSSLPGTFNCYNLYLTNEEPT